MSEISSLVDCFAGGIDDASVVESGQCTAGVEPSASARSIVMGLMSMTVPVPSVGVSGKEVVVAGSGSVVAKRAAAGHSPKDVPPSKSRKIVSSDAELPLVVESPAAEKASIEPFEHSFNGRDVVIFSSCFNHLVALMVYLLIKLGAVSGIRSSLRHLAIVR